MKLTLQMYYNRVTETGFIYLIPISPSFADLFRLFLSYLPLSSLQFQLKPYLCAK